MGQSMDIMNINPKVALTKEDDLHIMRRAREIISDPRHWTTEYFARGRWFGTKPYAEGALAINKWWASCFCLRGAICLAIRELGFIDWRPLGGTEMRIAKAMAAMLNLPGNPSASTLSSWHDEQSHAAVLGACDTFIETLRSA